MRNEFTRGPVYRIYRRNIELDDAEVQRLKERAFRQSAGLAG